MEEILERNDEETISSLEIAAITGKRHGNVMRDIRNMVKDIKKNNKAISDSIAFSHDYNSGMKNKCENLSKISGKIIWEFGFNNNKITNYIIKQSFYIDAKGEARSMYLLNKKASLLLALGYNISLRATIINRWEELERKNKQNRQPPKTYLEALKELVSQVEKEEQLKLKK